MSTSITEEIDTFSVFAGKPMRILKLFYEPTLDYHGSDGFSIKQTSFGAPKTKTFEIIVK